MFRPNRQDEMMLLPPSLRDFLPETHPAHMVNDLVERLDLSVMEARYGRIGQPAYHPRLMLRVILYGFTVGIFSSRKLQRACEENLAFKYLAGMETPAFKTFIEFRRRHREDMKAVFVATVKLARELGLAKLGAVALDGCKLEANTSKHKAMSYGRMGEEEERLKKEMEALLRKADETDEREDDEDGPDGDGYSLKEELARREERLNKIAEAKAALEDRERREHPDEPIDTKKQISFADHDARCFASKSNGTRYIYNSQAAVDMESGIIVENHIEDSTQDAKAAQTALETMKADLGQLPGKLVADAGYGNRHTVESCRKNEVTPVCAVSREGKEADASGGIDSFSLDVAANAFICPHGNVFQFQRRQANVEKSIYVSRETLPCRCSGERLKDGRGVLRVHDSHFAKRKLRRIMDEPANRKLYSRRKCTIEPTFGQVQTMGFVRYFYRGAMNVRSEWNLVCAAFNLRKIAVLSKAKSLASDLFRPAAHSIRLLSDLVAAIRRQAAPLLQSTRVEIVHAR